VWRNETARDMVTDRSGWWSNQVLCAMMMMMESRTEGERKDRMTQIQSRRGKGATTGPPE